MGAAYDYVSTYHTLPIVDQDLGISQTAYVQQYYTSEANDPNVRPRIKKEKGDLWKALKKLNVELITNTFYFPETDVLGKNGEPFYKPGFNRVFAGRGSPMEIRDVLRLAYRAGRIGKNGVRATLDAYVRDFITCDCNGFMGNLFNLSPHMHICNWATANAANTSDEKLDDYGWLEVDKLMKGYLPLETIEEASDIAPGDVIITVSLNNKDPMARFKHVAVVDGINSTGGNNYYVQVVEWGGSGADNHYNPAEYEVVEGPDVPAAGYVKKAKNFGVGWWESKSKNLFRYFFKRPCEPNPATWGRCGFEDV